MTSEVSTGKGHPTAMQNSLPLFYTNPRPITQKRHANTSVKKEHDFAFASKTNSIPLAADEFAQAARFYPIVFSPKDPYSPLALVGLKEGANLFVTENNQWEEGYYIPAYCRRYPFILSSLPVGKEFTLCIDEGSGLIEESNENPLLVEGEPSEFLNDTFKLCEDLQRDFFRTAAFAQSLTEAGLLIHKEVTISTKDSGGYKLTGIRIVDEEKLSEVDDKTFLEWRSKGWLGIIYAHLLSLGNLSRLVQRSHQAS